MKDNEKQETNYEGVGKEYKNKKSFCRHTPQLHLAAEESGVVEVGHGPLHGQGVSHLHHGTSFLGLQELDLKT